MLICWKIVISAHSIYLITCRSHINLMNKLFTPVSCILVSFVLNLQTRTYSNPICVWNPSDIFPGLQGKLRGSLWHCTSKPILFGNCFSPPVKCSSHKHSKRLLSSIKATDRNSHHFVEYLISLNHSLSEHMGFPGCHLQGSTKPQKSIFNLKRACGSD